jgi:hypothetical protein
MGVFDKVPLQRSMKAAELAAVVGKDESVISRCLTTIVTEDSISNVTLLHQ